MEKIMKFYEMEMEKVYDMTLLVRSVKNADKPTSKGVPYVRVELFDGQKSESVSFFDATADKLASEGIKEDAILKIRLKKTLSVKDNKIYYNQEGWEICKDPTVTRGDFAHKAPIDPETAFQNILNTIKKVDSNPDGVGPYKSISHLTLKLLQENAEAFKRSSAAVSMHHNYLSGLLYHTYRMIQEAWYACRVYERLDKELMICATALHDIGKITCYETTDVGDSAVTVVGRLLDHAAEGIKMIHDAAKEDLYNPEKVLMLEHTIASHHGKKEWDAITTPAIPEAEMLHLIDMMDSHMNMFEEAYKEQLPGTLSDAKVYGLENSYIYKPTYYENASSD